MSASEGLCLTGAFTLMPAEEAASNACCENRAEAACGRNVAGNTPVAAAAATAPTAKRRDIGSRCKAVAGASMLMARSKAKADIARGEAALE